MPSSIHKKDSVIITLEVQSSHVRGSLVIMNPDMQPHILFVHETPVAYKPNSGSAHLIKVTVQAIEKTTNTVLRHSRKLVHAKLIPHGVASVHYILSSPWIMPRARSVVRRFKKEIKTKEKHLNELLQNEREEISLGSEGLIEIIEEKISDVRINGYPVALWKGKRADKIELSFVMSVASSAVISHFRKAVAHAATADRVAFHSALTLQHIGINIVAPDKTNYELVDIHGELTDILVSENKACSIFGSYPIGVYTLVREASKELKMSTHAAESLISMYERLSLDHVHNRKIISATEKHAKQWLTRLHAVAVQNGMSKDPIRNIIVSADVHEDFFIRTLKTEYPRIKIESLSADEFVPLVSYDQYVPRIRSLSLCVSALRNLGY